MTPAEKRSAPVDAGGRLLAAVGLSEAEERAYLVLLEHPMATVAEVADLLGKTPRWTSTLLAALEAKGMVTRSLDDEVRFEPAPPEAAVEALIARRQRELSQALRHAKSLAARKRPGGGFGRPRSPAE